MFDKGPLMYTSCVVVLGFVTESSSVMLKDILKLSLDSRQPLGVYNSYPG